MKTVAGIFILLSLVAAPALAAPAFPVEELLIRAKFVCIAEVDSLEGTNMTLTVREHVRGDEAPNTLSFIVGTEHERLTKGQRYFVFSQGLDHWARPTDTIELGQGMKGQAGYCGWIMLLIEKVNGEDIVRGAFSVKFRKPGGQTGVLTMEQAKQLVREAEGTKHTVETELRDSAIVDNRLIWNNGFTQYLAIHQIYVCKVIQPPDSTNNMNLWQLQVDRAIRGERTGEIRCHLPGETNEVKAGTRLIALGTDHKTGFHVIGWWFHSEKTEKAIGSLAQPPAAGSALGVVCALAQQSTESVKTDLTLESTRFQADAPIIVDVWVENQTKQDIERGQFSPVSSSVGLPHFVITRVPDGKEFSISPGLYGDDWGQWYQPVSVKEPFAVGGFRLPPGKRIHLLHGDLRRAVVRAREHCQRALDEKLLLERADNATTKRSYQDIVLFADDFLGGGTFDIYVHAYSKSGIIRITVGKNMENSEQSAGGERKSPLSQP